MPICTNCSHPTPYLYTVYDSEDNLRLEQCSSCHAFADPYVEHDALTLGIDLMLLKRDVFRHLLFNRGAGARRLSNKSSGEATSSENPQSHELQREKGRRLQILRLGFFLVAVDASDYFSHSMDPSHPGTVEIAQWNQDALESYFRVLTGCLIETVGFHVGVTLASFIVLHALDWLRSHGDAQAPSGLRTQFRCSHIPLTILYSSLNKFFLLFLLTIWRPNSQSSSADSLQSQYNATNLLSHPMLRGALEMLDDDKLDREWIIRNVLGGMATGFGLRVVLDCHPVFTTMIILTGWAVKTALAHLVSGWVGASISIQAGSEGAEEIWLAYSIP
ncbi:uncharacterized protein PHACADRAFT_158843 [Phanerochaete carnosa HHB-10118-sp]|uniref:Protein ARV n=1 Tax=Phanerochaete carnosa (strain HHB-10118-sp) TaxID=650164 RepID=K5W1V1_PHACS|nr:uncharacterized protein PHACADRAFT_158843 [Phanerochaete carnosa HHB-10118-sp]EKM57803.1 hypothetical protein PHACADRAFT_158843 [Phanerochaete carnosa HHB-10118-sp]